MYFCHTEIFAYGEIIERRFRNFHPLKLTQRTHDIIIITSLRRQNDTMTSFWHHNDVIIASFVRWITWGLTCESTLFPVVSREALITEMPSGESHRSVWFCHRIKKHGIFSLTDKFSRLENVESLGFQGFMLIVTWPLWNLTGTADEECRISKRSSHLLSNFSISKLCEFMTKDTISHSETDPGLHSCKVNTCFVEVLMLYLLLCSLISFDANWRSFQH